AVGEHAVIANLDQLERGDHHPDVEERAGSDPDPRGPRSGDPDVRLEQGVRADLEPSLAQRLEYVPVYRPAGVGLAPHELPVDPEAVPGKQVVLVEPPPLHPQLELPAGGGRGPLCSRRARGPLCSRRARGPLCARSAKPAQRAAAAARLRGAGRRRGRPFWGALSPSTLARNWPVWEAGFAATCSGVPAAISI